MTKPTAAQIQAAQERGITVTASGNGAPTAEDYTTALEAHDAELASQGDATKGSGTTSATTGVGGSPNVPQKLDETIKGGRYVNTSGQLVNAHGQRINDDGSLVDENETPKTGAEPRT